jgi:hypothetical protein
LKSGNPRSLNNFSSIAFSNISYLPAKYLTEKNYSTPHFALLASPAIMIPGNSVILSQLHCVEIMGGNTRGGSSLMVAFRKVFGMPLEAMIVQILGKGKDKKGKFRDPRAAVETTDRYEENQNMFSHRRGRRVCRSG